MVFTVSTKNYLGNRATIVTHDEMGNEIPVLNVLPSGVNFPGDIAALAANITSILNGNKPIHKINMGSSRIFWHGTPNGIELRLNHNDEGTIA